MANNTLYDVAVIGYGPAGATLANLLGASGLSVLVLDKEAGIYPLPRAIHFDGEVMRVFQNAGLRAEVEAISRPGLTGMHFVNAEGETLLVRGGTTAHGPHGCASNYYFHQPELEQVLRTAAQRYPKVQVQLRHEVTQVTDQGEQVELTVRDLNTGQDHVVQARYVVGCDGARSPLRHAMGSTMVDLGLKQPWLVFDVRLKDGAPPRPDHTVQYCDPARPMTWCNVTGKRRRWEIMVLPSDDPAELVKPETLWQLVDRWMGPEHAELERAVIYTFHSLIAEGWRKGRLLLAGDAAHQTPPFLGQGMCAAVRDAANLAWKLAAVLHGQAGDALLDSYESERAPHVRAFIELAVKLGGVIQTTDPEAARARDAKFQAGQPEIFEYPTPGLGTGLTRGPAPAGQCFPQPTLADGQRLDDRVGPRFAIVATRALLAQAGGTTAQAVVLDAEGEPALRDWLQAQGCAGVVIRPDRYVLGTARNARELAALVSAVPGASQVATPTALAA